MRLLTTLAVILLVAADTPKEDGKVKDEMTRLQVTWSFTSVEVEGMKIPAEATKGSTMVLKDDPFAMTSFGATYKGTYKVDPAKSPKTLDIHFTEGPEKGNDSLGLTGKTRPTEFVSKFGSGHVLETLKREKK